MQSASSVYETMNHYGATGTPFLFIIDFDEISPILLPLSEAGKAGIFYNIRGISNSTKEIKRPLPPVEFEKYPVNFSTYLKAFNQAMAGLQFGNSYLLNLTFQTPIRINRGLTDIYHESHAPYKLLFRDEFTVFSPESFVRMEGNTISSFPMKGTIDASLPEAARQLLSDAKEMAEHHTIVDLIRNDLSMISREVRVRRFRYLEEIQTNQKRLLQASSEIYGKLPHNWQSDIGSLMQALLPAGSISGAPKKKTVEIIHQAETGHRGYYTGVFGIFDGSCLDSGVMIRYIEQQNGQIYFRSGGGITINSKAESEYQEMIDKVYVPFV
ncbi:MAG: aminodeoxychorismate synthase component I [Lentimicrobium sp.]|nr:aminodeoxychorismate synthase component I [Lentimicrobium sp.]